MDLLGERVERNLAASKCDRRREIPGVFCASSHSLQQCHHSRSVLLAPLVDPVLVEVLEQIALAELERVLQPTLRQKSVELAHVGPDLIRAGQGDHVAGGQEIAIGVGAERATQRG